MDEILASVAARMRGALPANPATELSEQLRQLEQLGQTILWALALAAVVWALFHLLRAVSAWRWKRSVRVSLETQTKLLQEQNLLLERQTKALETIAKAIISHTGALPVTPPAPRPAEPEKRAA